jgi:hypothetical protein
VRDTAKLLLINVLRHALIIVLGLKGLRPVRDAAKLLVMSSLRHALTKLP